MKQIHAYVYILTVGGLTKIGRTNNPLRRITGMSLQNNPIIFCYPHHDTQSAERYLHDVFKAQREKGEWFRLSDKQRIEAQRLLELYI